MPSRGAGRARHDPVGEGRCRCPSWTPRCRRSAGFNLIATANDRDRGVNELSSALRRRFNTVVLPLPATAEEEVAIVARRVAELGAALALPDVAGRGRRDPPRRHHLPRAARRRHRGRPDEPQDADRHAVARPRRSPSSPTAWRSPPTSATARCGPTDVAGGIVGAVVRDPLHDDVAWREYLEGVVRDRDGWEDFYDACRQTSTDVGRDGRLSSASATTGRARRGRCARALDELRPDVVLVEAPADAAAALALDRPRRARPAGRPARLRRRPARPRRVRSARLVQPGVAGRAVGGRATASPCEPIDLPLALTLGEPPDPICRAGRRAARPARRRWPPPPASPTPSGGGRTSSSTAATASRSFDAVAEAMAADPRRDLDVTARRRGARRTCAGASAARSPTGSTVAVVCGAWHVPALYPDAATAAADAAALRGRPKVKVGVTWVPWTHRRLAPVDRVRRRGGAAPAGTPTCSAHPGPDGVSRFFVDAAHMLRRQRAAGLARPPDRRVPAGGVARRAARPAAAGPGRGARRRRRRARRAADSSSTSWSSATPIGEVPPDAPQVPLARDLAACQRTARLKPESAAAHDRARPAHAERAASLAPAAPLAALGVPWGQLSKGGGRAARSARRGTLAWEPELSVRLVEQAGHGTTVVAAATSWLVEQAAAAHEAGRRHRGRRAGPARRPPRRRRRRPCAPRPPRPPARPTSPS